MAFVSKYLSKQPDSNGFITYTETENNTWKTLYDRQLVQINNRACDEFIKGLELLQISNDEIPQIPIINKYLKEQTGWQMQPVEALIPHKEFFTLLSNKKFPVATFIRTPEELNYVTEPDIFHEIFGHCPMLTDPVFADFVCEYGKKVLTFDEKDWPLLQRFFWFTVEFGLINTNKGLRIYGGGILSSIQETEYSVESDIPVRKPYEPVNIFRTPYRIDQLQKIYYVIDDYNQLYDFISNNINKELEHARNLGEFKPLFNIEDLPSVHIHHC